MPFITSRIGAGVLALALIGALASCGGDDRGQALPPPPRVDAGAPALNTFDIYALGAGDGSESRADVYGLTLNPLRAYRLTATTRISWLSADRDRIVVAAADEQFDKLGLVAAGGAIVPIPGLGRPGAFSPEVQPDGTIRYEDDGVTEAINTRYLSFDPKTAATTVLFTSKDEFNLAAATPGGGFLAVVQETDRDDQILLMNNKGVRKAITIAPRIASPMPGSTLISAPVYGSSNIDAPATDTALLNPKTGKVRIIKGWAPLGWAPGGTKLLVTRTGDTRLPDAELAVLDPANPGEPQILGTIPGLTFFSASWVNRAAAAS